MLVKYNDRRFSIDTEKLVGGEFVPPETIEEITGITRDQSAYGLMMLGVITDANYDLRDSALTVCQFQHGIKILNDSDSAQYHQIHFNRSALKMDRSNHKLSKVDANKLAVHQRKQHERNVINNSKVLQAMQKADRELLG